LSVKSEGSIIKYRTYVCCCFAEITTDLPHLLVITQNPVAVTILQLLFLIGGYFMANIKGNTVLKESPDDIAKENIDLDEFIIMLLNNITDKKKAR
jgi:hypothetical protein